MEMVTLSTKESGRRMRPPISLEKYFGKTINVLPKNNLFAGWKSPSQKKKSSVWHPRNWKMVKALVYTTCMLNTSHTKTHQIIADILKKSVDYLDILKEGIRTLLRKPPKNNLRPFILLPTVEKFSAILIIERTWEKLKDHIPKYQAAYQKGRNTTEQSYVHKTTDRKSNYIGKFQPNYIDYRHVKSIWYCQPKDTARKSRKKS